MQVVVQNKLVAVWICIANQGAVIQQCCMEPHLKIIYVDTSGIRCCAQLVADGSRCCSCEPSSACADDTTRLQVLQDTLKFHFKCLNLSCHRGCAV